MTSSPARPYRLGLDLGTNSLGWFVVWLEHDGDRWRPIELGPGGVRVFPDGRDPQSGTSNAVDRRTARSARKRRDRFVDRRKRLMDALIRHGLMPADEKDRKALEALDPYKLRAKALDGPLPAHHVGRALFHLNQRRGFLSNRKAERKDDDKGAIKQGATKLKEVMAAEKARTLGEFLWQRHQKRESVRARNVATGPKAAYDFYPTRELFLTEFEALWNTQAPHHTTMTKAARDEIHRIIFFQRELKPAVVGKCSFDPATAPFEQDPEGYRCSWAHPLAQRFRIFKEVRNLEIRETGKIARKLAKEEGDKIALALLQNNKVSFDKIRTLLKLPLEARFNLESERRDHLKGDELAEKLANRNLFGKAWRAFPLDRQIMIAEKLLREADPQALVEWLQRECGLESAVADKVTDAQLPDGHCRLGLRALKKLRPIVEDAVADNGRLGVQEHEAAARVGYDHAKLPSGEILDRLPYYGEWLPDAVVGTGDPRSKKEKRFGQFPNPTVHIGLGQLRRLVNALIKEFGAPEQVVIEFTRGLKHSPKEKIEIRREQQRNQDNNERRAEHMLGLKPPIEPNARNLLKYRLWEELNLTDVLDRKCPFTGEQISIERLFSPEVEVEHLIPFKESLDDSAANKTVSMRYANRAKRKQWPYKAFGSSPMIDGFAYRWEEIAARAAMLPKNKRWRFDADAREQFEEKGGFLNRQLNETGWLSRLAKQYIGAVTNPNEIWVVPGRLTSMIRGKWGLNALLPDHNYAGVQDKSDDFIASTDDMEFSGVKNRADHRHHAIDAMVAALTDRSLLQRMSRAYDEEREKIEIPTPWDKDKLRDELKRVLDRMAVSHKPDHGMQGKLHEDTAYGFVREPDKEEANLVYRKPIEALNENEIERIRDRRLRDMVRAHVAVEKSNGVALTDALRKLHAKTDDPHIKHGLRHIRLLKLEKPEYLVPIQARRSGGAYKAYSAGENFCVEIFETVNGNWNGEAIRRFDANQSAHASRWRKDHPDARFIMRVHKGDLIRLDHDGQSKIMVVHRLDAAANRFKLAPHHETGNLDRRHATDNEIDPFRWLMASYNTLKKMGAERVRVDELGRVWRVHPTC
jgi:CRISPR-associated endonuclease Csn1